MIIELNDEATKHGLSEVDTSQLNEDVLAYIAAGKTIGQIAGELLHPFAVKQGMTILEEQARLNEMIQSIWNCLEAMHV